jgi:hypothetical protein
MRRDLIRLARPEHDAVRLEPGHVERLPDHLEAAGPGPEREHDGVGVHHAVAAPHRDTDDAAVPRHDALHLPDEDLGAGRGEDGLGEEARVDLRGGLRRAKLPRRRGGRGRVHPVREQRVRGPRPRRGDGGHADGERVDGAVAVGGGAVEGGGEAAVEREGGSRERGEPGRGVAPVEGEEAAGFARGGAGRGALLDQGGHGRGGGVGGEEVGGARAHHAAAADDHAAGRGGRDCCHRRPAAARGVQWKMGSVWKVWDGKSCARARDWIQYEWGRRRLCSTDLQCF